MPKTQRKKVVPLHVAKSFSELNGKIKVEIVNDPKFVMKSAPTIFKKAEKMREEGDEEQAYILYMRYYESVIYAKKSPMAKDKKYFESMIKPKDVKNSMEWAEKLAESLEKRFKRINLKNLLFKVQKARSRLNMVAEAQIMKIYDLLKEEEEATNRLKLLNVQTEKDTDEIVNSNAVNIEIEKAVPTLNVKAEINGSHGKEGGSADCNTLYNDLLDKSISVLIMDARNAKDFSLSHITSPRSINIPAEIITPGITAHRLRQSLPAESIELWDKRGNVDIIYLLDWFSSIESLSTEITSLKDAIYKWDMITKLKHEPVVLSGGYDKWLTYYPTVTTNSRVERPKNNIISTSPVSLNFDYPSEDLDRAFIESTDDFTSSVDSTGSSLFSAIPEIQPSVTKSTPNIDRTTKPKPTPVSLQIEKDVTPLSSKHSKPEMEWKEIEAELSKPSPGKPLINRNLKPKGAEQGPTENEEIANERLEMWESVTKYEKYANEALKLEKERLEKEMELNELRLRREKEAEESMRLEIQKQESDLLNRISTMEEHQKKLEMENKAVMDENESLKQRLDELTSQKDEECKRLKEEHIKNQKKEQERRTLEKEVQRLRTERIRAEKIKENIVKVDKSELTIKNSLNTLTSENKATPVDKTPLRSIENLGNQIGTNKGTNFAKLKDTNSVGNLSRFGKLSRAHSFHNISQLSDSEENVSSSSSSFAERSIQSPEASKQQRVIPIIDRCSKPSPTEISGTLTRNFMPVFGGMGSALTGLRNLGNTCYMNSILQCLTNTVPLVHFFRSGAYRNQINRSGKLRGILVEEFAAIIHALYLGQYRSISPRDFRNVICQYDKSFENCEQQDPQEFLNCVMDNLHEELKRSKPNQTNESAQLIKSLDDSSLPDDVIAARSWEMYKLHHNSVITDMFQGQYRSTLKCLHCSKKAVKFDTFMFLSLPIPSGVNRCTLKDCLQLFLKEEKLEGASKWKCPKCNELRDAVKKIDIWKLPPVLLIHFKRFYYEGMWKGKMQTYIDFSVSEALDLQTYVKGSHSANSFNLYAVTNHSGTLDGGHCIAYCKNSQNSRWYKYDDQDVREMPESDVKSSGAYILYYITRNGSGSRLI